MIPTDRALKQASLLRPFASPLGVPDDALADSPAQSPPERIAKAPMEMP
jgi:hypothetical protein